MCLSYVWINIISKEKVKLMRFYQIIVLLGICASNIETPPSARKRGFKLEFVGDIFIKSK